MTKEEIKEYLNRVDKLLDKLKGEDKETLIWLIYGYNQCAKLLNETQKENKKLKVEYGNKVQVERDLLKEENEKLKAELQLYQGALKREHEAIHRAIDLEERIDKARELLGNYRHYSTPDEKQNGDNEDLVNNAFDILKEVE